MLRSGPLDRPSHERHPFCKELKKPPQRKEFLCSVMGEWGVSSLLMECEGLDFVLMDALIDVFAWRWDSLLCQLDGMRNKQDYFSPLTSIKGTSSSCTSPSFTS